MRVSTRHDHASDRILPGAFKYRNFRLFFFGQSVSLIGTWMQLVAMSWLVYEKTGSGFWLGVVGFCGQLPSFFLAPIAGVYADRWNRHRTIVIMQTLAMLQAFVLAALVLGSRRRRVAHRTAERHPGRRHGLRGAGTAVVFYRDGGRPRSPGSRHWPELLLVQCGAGHRTGAGRLHDQGYGRRNLLPAQRRELRGGDRGLAGHAASSARAGPAAAARAR